MNNNNKKQVHIKPALYALYYESLKEIAFSYGYNLILHGSINRDLDLIAIPWIEDIKSHDDMIKEMCDYLGGDILVNDDNLLYSKKPHGRICYIINIFRGGYDAQYENYTPDPEFYLDISVLPTL